MTTHTLVRINERIDFIARARAEAMWRRTVRATGSTVQAEYAERDTYLRERHELRTAHGLPTLPKE